MLSHQKLHTEDDDRVNTTLIIDGMHIWKVLVILQKNWKHSVSLQIILSVSLNDGRKIWSNECINICKCKNDVCFNNNDEVDDIDDDDIS